MTIRECAGCGWLLVQEQQDGGIENWCEYWGTLIEDVEQCDEKNNEDD